MEKSLTDYQLKALELVKSIQVTASSVVNIARQLPKTGKKHRNIFIKVYNRKPGNKKKRAAGMLNMAISSVMGAASIARIVSQPMPKYPRGSYTGAKMINE